MKYFDDMRFWQGYAKIFVHRIFWEIIFFFKGLVPECHSFCLFFIYPSAFAKASLHFLIACLLSGEKPPCGAEPRIEFGPALQQADELPTEPHRRIISSQHFSWNYLFQDNFRKICVRQEQMHSATAAPKELLLLQKKCIFFAKIFGQFSWNRHFRFNPGCRTMGGRQLLLSATLCMTTEQRLYL